MSNRSERLAQSISSDKDGCELYAACLTCPRARCIYDEPRPLPPHMNDQRIAQAATRAEIRRRLDAGESASSIKADMKVSQGLVSKARNEVLDA